MDWWVGLMRWNVVALQRDVAPLPVAPNVSQPSFVPKVDSEFLRNVEWEDLGSLFMYGLHIGDTFLSELQVNGLKHLVFTRLAPKKRMVAQIQVTGHGVEGVALELQHVEISEEESVIAFVLHEKQGPSFSYYTVEHINHCCMKKAGDVTLCNLNIVRKKYGCQKVVTRSWVVYILCKS